MDGGGLVSQALAPQNPLTGGRPRVGGGQTTDNQAEVTCTQRAFVDLGTRRSAANAAHSERLADIVDLADERQHRNGQIRKGEQAVLDDEPARHHPVVHHELFQQFGDSGPGPGNPAVERKKPPLRLSWQQGLAVVELTQEIQP